MKALLLLIVLFFSLNSRAQFVQRAYDAQQMELEAESLYFDLINALKPSLWRGGIEDVMMMPEGNLNIPMIEFGFVVIEDTTDSHYNYSTAENSFQVIMLMFDKSATGKVKKFFNEFVGPTTIVNYYETSTTISCLLVETEEELSSEQEMRLTELKALLKKYLEDHYDQL